MQIVTLCHYRKAQQDILDWVCFCNVKTFVMSSYFDKVRFLSSLKKVKPAWLINDCIDTFEVRIPTKIMHISARANERTLSLRFDLVKFVLNLVIIMRRCAPASIPMWGIAVPMAWRKWVLRIPMVLLVDHNHRTRSRRVNPLLWR